MPQQEPDDDGPSLELPSFGLGRKRRRQRSAEPEPPPATEPEGQPATEPEERALGDRDAAPGEEVGSDQVPASDPVPSPPDRPEPDQQPEPQRGDQLVEDPVAEQADEPAEEPRRKRRVTLPAVGSLPAALVTGALVGVLIVGLTWLSLRLCELVRGTSSCGNPGFFLLLAIGIAMVLLGSLLLSAFDVPEAGSTSFLGVGLIAMLVLVFLTNLLFNWWMILVIPAVAAGSFGLAHWVTRTFAGPETGGSTHR